MSGGLKTVLIGGGTGFIGSAIKRTLQKKGFGVVVVSRKPGLGCISWSELSKDGLPPSCTAVVNVAGQNVLDPTRRWTPGFKQNVLSSRVNTTHMLAEAIMNAKTKPDVFVCMSGVGYYKPSEKEEYTEESKGGDFDFMSKLCTEWEDAGKLPENVPVRHVVIRSGVVLGREGGMISQLFWPFFAGFGGPVGSGQQYMPWIHIHDIANLFAFAIENNKVKGILNGVSPEIVTNREFATTFAKAMWRPAFIPLPLAVVNLAFSEERAKIMTEGQKVIPKRTVELGFQYEYPDMYSACKHCSRLIYADEFMSP